MKIVISCLLLLAFTAKSQTVVTDYLAIGDQIIFNEEPYQLSWSSHPTEGYYKQEYLRPSDNNVANFEQMIMVEAIAGDLSIEQALGIKIAELEDWKKSDPSIRYQLFQHKENNEAILDFVVNDGAQLVEWNVYRYKQETTEQQQFLVLYAHVQRATVSNDVELQRFVQFIKQHQSVVVQGMANLELPKVQVKQ